MAAASAAAICALSLVIVVGVSLLTSAPALAVSRDVPASLEISGSSTMQLARVDMVELPVQTTPASIQTGIPCGMTEMCGQDPCLCGAVDGWGACACNGLTETRPSFMLTYSVSDIVGTFDLVGHTYVFALGTGTTDAVLYASLPHHETVQMDMHIEVAPFSVLDAGKLVVLLIVVVVLGAIVILAVRGCVKAARAGVRRLAQWRQAKAAHGREEGERCDRTQADVGQNDGMSDSVIQGETITIEQTESKGR